MVRISSEISLSIYMIRLFYNHQIFHLKRTYLALKKSSRKLLEVKYLSAHRESLSFLGLEKAIENPGNKGQYDRANQGWEETSDGKSGGKVRHQSEREGIYYQEK